MILLKHDTIDESNIVISGGKIHGEYVPPRTYTNKNNFVEMTVAPHIQDNDIAEFYALGYRIATPKEQEEYYKSFLKQTEIKEVVQEKNISSQKRNK